MTWDWINLPFLLVGALAGVLFTAIVRALFAAVRYFDARVDQIKADERERVMRQHEEQLERDRQRWNGGVS